MQTSQQCHEEDTIIINLESFLLRLLKGPLHSATLGKVSRDQLGTKKEKHFPSLSTWTVPLLSPSPPSLSLLLGLPSFPLFLSLHLFPFLFIFLAGKSVWAIMPFRNTKVAKLIPKLTSLLSAVGFLLIVYVREYFIWRHGTQPSSLPSFLSVFVSLFYDEQISTLGQTIPLAMDYFFIWMWFQYTFMSL